MFYFRCLFLLLMIGLSSCSQFFEKDNLPKPSSLISFSPEIHPQLLFRASPFISANQDQLKLAPAFDDHAIYTASNEGYVTAIDQKSGQTLWQTRTRLPLTSGPGIGNHLIFVGSRFGTVLSLNADNGKMLWQQNVRGEILANPVVAKNKLLIKTTDGGLFALDANDGHLLWQFQQSEPNLILHGSSKPIVINNSIIVGFANGSLAKLDLNDGNLLWLQPIAVPQGAFSIQRMIDIDADPYHFQNHLYAATYQGQIASLNLSTGQIKWSHRLSSYTGMVADDQLLYLTDAEGVIWAFNVKTGEVVWKQTKLRARQITAPTIIDNYLVIGDKEGYLHWLDKRDAHFVSRQHLKAPIIATPLTIGNRIYVKTMKGHLFAYQLN